MLVYYCCWVIYVENVIGVIEVVSFEIMFNLIFQMIYFYYICVICDGEIEDWIDWIFIEFVCMEIECDCQIFNGEVMVLICLDDVCVGDIVDYVYMIIGNNLIFVGYDFKQFNFNYGILIEVLKVCIIWNWDDVGFWDVWIGQFDEIEEVVM